MKKFFKVTAKCGHVGKNKYILIDFPVTAEDAKEAAKKARQIPRVKHHQKDAIDQVVEISKEMYIYLVRFNKQDNYLNCSSNQEQYTFHDEIEERVYNKNFNYKPRLKDRDKNYIENSKDVKFYHKVRVKNYKKYVKMMEEQYGEKEIERLF